MLVEWLANETKILQSLSETRLVGSGQKVEWPEMESRLFAEFMLAGSINHKWFLGAANDSFMNNMLALSMSPDFRKDGS